MKPRNASIWATIGGPPWKVFMFCWFNSAACWGNVVEVPALPGFGNGNNGIPFSFDSTFNRYQQIYSASSFLHGGLLDGIRFRTEEGRTIISSLELDLSISVGYSAKSVADASPIYAENIGPGYVEVLDGHLSLPIAEPNGLFFNVEIDLLNKFYYNPSLGDLLLDIDVLSTTGATSFDESGGGQQTATQRVFSGLGSGDDQVGVVGANSNFSTPTGLVTQFVFIIPEPATSVLALTALCFVARRGRSSIRDLSCVPSP